MKSAFVSNPVLTDLLDREEHLEPFVLELLAEFDRLDDKARRKLAGELGCALSNSVRYSRYLEKRFDGLAGHFLTNPKALQDA